MSVPGPSGTARGATATRQWAPVTVAALILAALGLAFAFAGGIGLPFAVAGVICGGIALRRDPAARPWPLLGLLASALGVVIAAVLILIAATAWLPVLPALLLG